MYACLFDCLFVYCFVYLMTCFIFSSRQVEKRRHRRWKWKRKRRKRKTSRKKSKMRRGKNLDKEVSSRSRSRSRGRGIELREGRVLMHNIGQIISRVSQLYIMLSRLSSRLYSVFPATILRIPDQHSHAKRNYIGLTRDNIILFHSALAGSDLPLECKPIRASKWAVRHG